MTYQSSPELSNQQKQILYGTILGGSSIIKPKKGKNCYLAMRDNNPDWLCYKMFELKSLFKQEGEPVKRDATTNRCYSKAYPIFNDMYDTFYVDGQKCVTKDILESLTDIAWMVWFLDSGRKSSRKAYLRTHKYGKEGSEIIAEYFNSLDCECDIHLCRNRYEIVFSNHGAYEYLKVIAHRMPKFMLHHLD